MGWPAPPPAQAARLSHAHQSRGHRRLLCCRTLAAACNGRHNIDQRLARWLLMGHDRAEGDEYPMTHEFLSMMLGVRRAGITVAAGQLAKAGFIRYEKGRIQITDRPGLE